MGTVIGISICLICMVVCHTIEKERQANTLKWAITGASFGPLAIPFSFLTRPKKPTSSFSR
ncbi:hypothetical protein ACFLZG_01760 [Thermodesulfobacteriota bacterium]